MGHVKFEVSKKYENMKGVYEVLSIDGNTGLSAGRMGKRSQSP